EKPEGSATRLQFNAGTIEARQSEDARATDFAAGVDGNDAATRAGKSERYDLRELSVLWRSWRGQDDNDYECGIASHAQHRDAQISGERARHSRDRESRRAQAFEGRGRRVAGRT